MLARPQPDPEFLWRVREPIVLLSHDPHWPAAGADEAHRIAHACGHPVARVEHIGSTSVPGLLAKPIIDLMPILHSFEAGFECVEPMRSLGYWYAGEFGIAGRHLFVKGVPRTHHVHMLVNGCREVRRHLAVRDTLRARPELAEQYATLKQELARTFIDDREGFSNAKADFMKMIFQEAGVD